MAFWGYGGKTLGGRIPPHGPDRVKGSFALKEKKAYCSKVLLNYTVLKEQLKCIKMKISLL